MWLINADMSVLCRCNRTFGWLVLKRDQLFVLRWQISRRIYIFWYILDCLRCWYVCWFYWRIFKLFEIVYVLVGSITAIHQHHREFLYGEMIMNCFWLLHEQTIAESVKLKNNEEFSWNWKFINTNPYLHTVFHTG